MVCSLLPYIQIYLLDFLFEASTVAGNKLHYYLIYQTVDNSCFAEVSGEPSIGRHFNRVKEDWTADDSEKQREADQLGEEVCRKKL
jgi:hypothetical protein